MTRPGRFERSLSPRQRTTASLIAGLDDRLETGTAVMAKREWTELRSRTAALLRDNAQGRLSAADVVAAFYDMGFSE